MVWGMLQSQQLEAHFNSPMKWSSSMVNGQWSTVEANELETLNWRELGSLVKLVASAVTKHDLRGYDIFIFTDNSTDEAAIWKGSSKTVQLFELVLELKVLEVIL